MITSDTIESYSKAHSCSLSEAKTALYRLAFCDELRSDITIGDIADTLIRILDFEFTGYGR